MSETKDLRDLRGLVATCVLTGSVKPEYAACHEEARVCCVKEGFVNCEWRNFNAVLVEQGRDRAVRHAFFKENTGYDWLLMIDADATFPRTAIIDIIETAFVDQPDADVVGAYSNLKNSPHLPTIDTGSGTWEVWYPNSGVVPVIRTGAHFMLVKKSAIEKLDGPPWFRTRLAERPIEAFHEVDNFARIKLDGSNPLVSHPEWSSLLHEAQEASAGERTGIGEDSSFCDRLIARGGRIYVDTDIPTGHVTRQVIGADDLKENMEKQERRLRLAVGVQE